jgi:hypothetical protein
MTGVVVVSTGCKDESVGKKRGGGGGGEEAEERERQQLSVLALLLAAVRRSVVACRVEREPDRVSGGGGGWRDDDEAASAGLGEMEIGWPTDVRHVAHVTFDRFHGFLGLPVEFEVEMPPRVPSARYSLPFLPATHEISAAKASFFRKNFLFFSTYKLCRIKGERLDLGEEGKSGFEQSSWLLA